jgi:transglutaminase-like putative cysteine protease
VHTIGAFEEARMRNTTALAILAAALATGAARAGEPRPDPYTIPLKTRHVKITYTVEIPELPGFLDRVKRDEQRVERLWVPAAHSDELQEVRALVPPLTSLERDPATGNECAYFQIEPGAVSMKATFLYDVVRHERLVKDFRGRGAQPLSEDEKKSLARELAPDRLVPIDGPIAERARRVAGGETNVVNLARRFYDDVRTSMKYDKSGAGWGRGDALWACDSRRGNCTDFHAVFIGMCRASGIPARFAIGFAIPETRGAGEIAGYHCWAEFYVAGLGWVPVDISEAAKHPELAEYYFGAWTEDRVEFTRGRDLVLVPPQKGEPLNFFVYPYLEVDGKPAPDLVKRTIRYEDVTGEDK